MCEGCVGLEARWGCQDAQLTGSYWDRGGGGSQVCTVLSRGSWEFRAALWAAFFLSEVGLRFKFFKYQV